MVSIRSDLTWSFTLEIAVLLTLLGAVAYWGTRSIIETQVSEAAVVGLTQTDRNLATIVGGASDLSLFLISNRNVRQLLAGPGPSQGLVPDRVLNLTEDLANLAGSKSSILSINLYGDNGLQYETAGPSTVAAGVLPGGWLARVPLDGTAVLTPTYRRDYQTLGPRNVISFCRRLIDVNHLTRGLGWIRIDLSEDSVAALYRGASLGETGAIFVTDGKGVVISHADKSFLGKDLSSDPVFEGAFARPGDGYGRVRSNGVELLVASHRSARDQVFVSVVPFRELTRDADRAGLWLLAVLSASLVGAFAVVRVIAQRITDPIPALIDQMRLVEEGDLDARVEVKSTNELGSLGDSFNRMTGKLKTLIDEVYTSQIVRREAELRALQAQINPHFLYNTLDVIYWTARMEAAPKTAEIVQALARLFKLGLNRGEEFTTVGREVEHLESYLVIQKVRFDDPPTVTVAVDPETFPCVTPKLILQPLVENAFVHGIAGLDRPGIITVTGRSETRDGAEVLVFTVEDNGVGMSDQRRVEVLSSDVGARDSYGVKNVDESLKLFFGPAFGLGLESQPGRGTRVTLVLPRTTVRPPEALR